MRKFIIVILCVFFGKLPVIKAQCFPELNKLKFAGAAPKKWAINGSVNDWQSILGPFTGNNDKPYIPPVLSRFNWGGEYFHDFDNPEPASDIRFTAFIHDDYNVYFYFRKLAKSKSSNAFYYFCDINADGYMNAGEPVFGAHFNADDISDLTVYKYVPDQNEDYIPGKGNQMTGSTPNVTFVDGYTMKGSVKKVFDGDAIPSAYALAHHEVFKAGVTENGYGIELAIPWRFFRNWNTSTAPLTPDYIFSYHLALQKVQKGPRSYQPQLVQDNVGNCCGLLSVSGNAAYENTGKSIGRNADGSYRLQVKLQNQTNVKEGYNTLGIFFDNIQLNEGMIFNPDEFLVTTYPDRNGNGNVDPGEDGTVYNYYNGTFLNQPVDYEPDLFEGSFTEAGPFGSAYFIVDIHLPANNSVLSVSVNMNTNSRFQGFLLSIYCFFNQGGGKGINPVGFDINTEELSQKTIHANEESTGHKSSDILRVYPNPNQGRVTIEIPGSVQNAEIRLEDATGKLIYRRSQINSPILSLDNLQPGFYILRIFSPHSGKQYVQKLIVQ